MKLFFVFNIKYKKGDSLSIAALITLTNECLYKTLNGMDWNIFYSHLKLKNMEWQIVSME